MNVRKIGFVISGLVALSIGINVFEYYRIKHELYFKKQVFDDGNNPLSLREFA